jgi:hypothetical protein
VAAHLVVTLLHFATIISTAMIASITSQGDDDE